MTGETVTAQPDSPANLPARRPGPGWYRWYVAGVLAVAGTLAQIDRQLMGLLTEPVKADLQLTDVQLSLLQGLAFIMFHAVMAFPLGYLIDRWPRRIVMGTGIFLWSIATMACGLARSFGQLFAARLSVGIGEASLIPTAQSLLPDYFEVDELAKGFAVLQLGMLLGGGGAYVIGGLILSLISTLDIGGLPLIGPLAPWQITFVIAAMPGPLIALLMLTLREPPRKANPLADDSGSGLVGMSKFLVSARWFLISHLGALAATSITVFGVVAWAPSFFIRTFGWTVPQAGIAYGTILLIFGGAGTLIAGQLAQVWTRRGDNTAPIRINILAFLVKVPIAIAFPLAGSPQLALACLAVFSFCVGATSTMMPTILQLATPHQLRGRMGAFHVLVTSAVGAALGPVLIALITDMVLGDSRRLNESIAIANGIFAPLTLFLAIWTYREFKRLTVRSWH